LEGVVLPPQREPWAAGEEKAKEKRSNVRKRVFLTSLFKGDEETKGKGAFRRTRMSESDQTVIKETCDREKPAGKKRGKLPAFWADYIYEKWTNHRKHEGGITHRIG